MFAEATNGDLPEGSGMAGNYRNSLSVEQEGLGIIIPLLRKCCCEGFILFDQGPSNKELQKCGDGIMRSKATNDVVTVEFKFERADRFGNFFLEEWSNRARFTQGWFRTSRADVLAYQFNSERTLYLARMYDLRQWAFGLGRHDSPSIYRFPLKPENESNQLNDTWGYCVPIRRLADEVRCKRISLDGSTDEVCEQIQLGLFEATSLENAAHV